MQTLRDKSGVRTVSGGTLGEKLLVKKLSSGLRVGVISRPEFVRKFAIIAARYGSNDTHYVSPATGRRVETPAGVAHFLEHKMFEKEWGDVFDRFSELGANANAFTSYTVTGYHFTCTGNFWENLGLLLELVGCLHITRQSVRKEVGIIQQEILMYEDNPDWKVATGLLEALYHRHPVRVDTAGTVDSVARITKGILLESFSAFYRPCNMMLVAAGALDAGEVFERCEGLSGRRADGALPKRLEKREPGSARQDRIISHMDVKRPKLLLGFKEGRAPRGGAALVRRTFETDLLMGIIFGKSGPAYLRMYEKGLIDESFSAVFTSDSGFGHSMIGGETDSPQELLGACLEAIRRACEKGLSRSDFDRTKKWLLGAYLRRFNSLEASAVRSVAGMFLGYNPFRTMELMESLTIGDIDRRVREHFRPESMAVSMVLPAGSQAK
jgi:predicted Zn-dependent peptidase